MLVAGSVLVIDAGTNGWFSYYIFDVPSRHPLQANLLTEFWTIDMGVHLPIGLIFCMFGLLGMGDAGGDRSAAIRDMALLAGLILTSYLSRIHSGGFDNALMPAAAGIAIFFGIGFAAATKVSTRRFVPTAAIAVAAVQFLMLAYSPRDQVPTRESRAEGERLVRRVAAIDGEVYLPDHPWYAVAAGKAPRAQMMGIGDVIRARGSEVVAESLRDELRLDVDQERYAAFVVDTEQFLLRPEDFERHYRLVDAQLTSAAFLPLTGMQRAPRLLFIRRSTSP